MSNNHSEDELFLLIRQGSEAAFDAFYNRYVNMLYLQAYFRLQDEATAKDAVQDVLIYFWNNRSTLAIRGSLQAYLAGAVRQRCVALLRKEVSMRNRQQIYAALYTSVTHSSDLEIKELNSQLQAAMALISPTSRRAFEMSYIERKTSKEIAGIMNIKVQTVKNHVQQALKVLRQHLKKI
ncbi:RNA polymerase sigma factor [Chitinophaga rhizophila]|uniref:Sigma-70 family RNA polymerase sigma factor n=1 Tax=Chitinophaga rhizophila TaxID=2866212 RepID=A0ABS7GKD2_9BACT|nr:sigma-70 family RNA polymerase sigma factor [Chitinophaga rhizophila]MBW8688180.1 sigma-70 family RNA polymerase sigma factor [Chitinophaga rhizophila]